MNNLAHNERIKLQSRALTIAGTWLIIVGLAVPLLLGRTAVSDLVYVGALCVVGVVCIIVGIRLLRKLR
jgi:hypothetical protein